MIPALLLGAVLGFVLALPPGPIGVAAIKYGLDGKRKLGTYFAGGAAVMDMMYCLVAIFAASAVKDSVNGFIDEHPLVLLSLQIALIVVFIALGYFNVKKKNAQVANEELRPKSVAAEFIDRLKTRGPFLVGIAIALTNLVNPSFLPFLGYLTINVHHYNDVYHMFEVSAWTNGMFALGFGIGNFLWLYMLVGIIDKYKSRMSDRMLGLIHQFAGYTLIGFGSILGYKVLAPKMPEFLRVVLAF